MVVRGGASGVVPGLSCFPSVHCIPFFSACCSGLHDPVNDQGKVIGIATKDIPEVDYVTPSDFSICTCICF